MGTHCRAGSKGITAAMLTVISLSGSFAVADNIVINGSFESPFAGKDFAMFQPGESFGGWTVALAWVDLVGTSVQAASGVQSVDLSGGTAGQIYQDLSTVPGQRYELRFAMAGSGVVEQQPPRIKVMQIGWGATLVDTPSFDITGHTVTDMGWTYHSYDLTAVSPFTRLQFTSLINTQWGPMIDDVRVTPVPEPGLVVLLGLGFGGLMSRMRALSVHNR